MSAQRKNREIHRIPIKLIKHNILKIFNDAFVNKDIVFYKT